MNAEQVIKLITTMEPPEIERLFVLIEEYEAEVRGRQTSVRYLRVEEKFEKIVDHVFTENKELLQMLGEYERKEREAVK